jgi:probable rRNA maturation factor
LDQVELSVLLTSDPQIRVLNREHRHKDRPTDVLSFGVCDSIGGQARSAPRLLGDVVISLDTAARQANSRKRPLIAEVRWLLAHGILHLVGFDHASAAQKRRMVAWTRRLVRAADLPDAKRPRPVKRRGRA